MSALPIAVEPTNPPTQHVVVLDQTVALGPADVFNPRWVIVYLHGPMVLAALGRPSPAPVRPELDEFTSPLAEILLKPSQCAIVRPDIVLLDPNGEPR